MPPFGNNNALPTRVLVRMDETEALQSAFLNKMAKHEITNDNNSNSLNVFMALLLECY